MDHQYQRELYNNRIRAVRRLVPEIIARQEIDIRESYVWTVIDGKKHKSWVMHDNEGIVPANKAITALQDSRLVLVRRGGYSAVDEDYLWMEVEYVCLREVTENAVFKNCDTFDVFYSLDGPNEHVGRIGWSTLRDLCQSLIKKAKKFGTWDKNPTGLFAKI